MKLLIRKLFREVKRNWSQFFSVFLMALLSIVVFVGLQGTWRGLETSLNTYTGQTDLANYWIRASSVTKKDTQKLANLTGAKRVEAGYNLQVKQKNNYLNLVAYNKPITKLYSMAGEKYQAKSHGIWLNQEYAQKSHLKVGQKLPLTCDQKRINLKIKGLIKSSEQIYFTGTSDFIGPNYGKYGYAYVGPQTLTSKLAYSGPQNYVTIKGKISQVRKKVEHIFGKRLISYDDRETLPAVSTALDRVNEIKNLSYLFSFIFVLLAVLAMYTTIKRLIEKQTSEIATLKALGFSNFQVQAHYSSFGLLIGGLGAVAGLLFAPLISWYVLRTQLQNFSLPKANIAYTPSAVVAVLAVLLICTFAAFLAARQAANGLPAVFLRGQSTSKVHHIFLEHFTTLWQHLAYSVRWLLRDIFINKTRTLMGIIGVCGSMMLMIAGLGMPQSMNHLVDQSYNHNYIYNKRISNADYHGKNVNKGQWLQVTQAHFYPDDGYNRQLTVFSSGQQMNLKTTTGKSLTNKGIYVTTDFAKRAHLKLGEQLGVKTFNNEKHRFKITGLINSDLGQGAYITKHAWKKAGGQFLPSTLLLAANADYHPTDGSSTVLRKQQKDNAQEYTNNLMSIFMLIIFLGLLLIVIVLYNLGSLSFVERTREYATLDVLGIKPGELKKLVFGENIMTTLIGWLLGIPAGIWFLGKYTQTFSTINIEYARYFNAETIITASIFVWLCSLLTTFFVSRKLKKIDMVQALKGVE